MPRPSTPIGTWGEINTKILSPGKARARCYYRDIDGKSRLVEKHAPTKAKAKQKLLETLKERTFITSTSLVDNKTTISDLSHKWLDRKNETKQIKRRLSMLMNTP